MHPMLDTQMIRATHADQARDALVAERHRLAREARGSAREAHASAPRRQWRIRRPAVVSTALTLLGGAS